MAALSVQPIIGTGLEAAYVSAAALGDTVADDGTQRTFLHVVNGSGADITVTVTAQSTSTTVSGYGAVSKANLSIVVTAGESRFIGPFPPVAFKDSSGLVHVGYSAVTTVTVAALSLPNV
jgi:hypothetical protein